MTRCGATLETVCLFRLQTNRRVEFLFLTEQVDMRIGVMKSQSDNEALQKNVAAREKRSAVGEMRRNIYSSA
jgi:hypothetical protein